MIRRLGIGFGAALWFVFVFWATYRLTFPSATVGERIAWEVQERSSYQLEMGSTHPWWVGLGASEVTLSSVDRRTGAASKMLTADHVRARISPFGLLSSAARVTGDVTLGEGYIDFYVDVAQSERGTDLHQLELSADGFPLGAVPPIGGFSLVGRGTMDLSAELDAPDGMNNADGHFRFSGQELIIESIPEADAMLQAMNVEILPLIVEDLDFDVEFVDGKGRVESGRLETSLATVEVSGQVVLTKRVNRSKCDLTVEVRPTEDMPQQALSLMASAKDGEVYKYKMSGVCARGNFRPARQARPAARRSPRPRAAAPPTPRQPARAGAARGRAVPPTADLTGPPSRRPIAGRNIVPGDEPDGDDGELLDDEELLEDDELLEDEELLEGEPDIAPDDY